MSESSCQLLSQATRALTFIQHQLREVTEYCDYLLQNNLVSSNHILDLDNNLQKILHETRAACTSPPKKPVKSDFDIIKTINSGAFGTVNLVCHKQTSQTFAMKEIKMENESMRNNVLMERDILIFLDHPFIVSMFCSFETESHMYMVMEHVGGGNCKDLLRKCGYFSVATSLFYSAELVMAVDYIHSFGVIHRDLKPENMLISATGHLKVADFGLSKVNSVNLAPCLTEEDCQRVAREFNDKEQCGTPYFMAPELYQNTGYGKPIDWWAVGVILFNFLTGSQPFIDLSSKQFEDCVIDGDISWPEGGDPLPYEARNLICLLLEKDPVKRLGTRGAFEVGEHPFFKGVDWLNLWNEMPPYVPEPEDEEETRSSVSPLVCDFGPDQNRTVDDLDDHNGHVDDQNRFTDNLDVLDDHNRSVDDQNRFLDNLDVLDDHNGHLDDLNIFLADLDDHNGSVDDQNIFLDNLDVLDDHNRSVDDQNRFVDDLDVLDDHNGHLDDLNIFLADLDDHNGSVDDQNIFLDNLDVLDDHNRSVDDQNRFVDDLDVLDDHNRHLDDLNIFLADLDDHNGSVDDQNIFLDNLDVLDDHNRSVDDQNRFVDDLDVLDDHNGHLDDLNRFLADLDDQKGSVDDQNRFLDDLEDHKGSVDDHSRSVDDLNRFLDDHNGSMDDQNRYLDDLEDHKGSVDDLSRYLVDLDVLDDHSRFVDDHNIFVDDQNGFQDVLDDHNGSVDDLNRFLDDHNGSMADQNRFLDVLEDHNRSVDDLNRFLVELDVLDDHSGYVDDHNRSVDDQNRFLDVLVDHSGYLDDQLKPPAERADFCYVAFPFNEVYGSPVPLSSVETIDNFPLSEKPGHSKEKEEQDLQEGNEGIVEEDKQLFPSQEDFVEKEPPKDGYEGILEEEQQQLFPSQEVFVEKEPPKDGYEGIMEEEQQQLIPSQEVFVAKEPPKEGDESIVEEEQQQLFPSQEVFVEKEPRKEGNEAIEEDNSPFDKENEAHHTSPVQMDPVKEGLSNEVLEASWALMNIHDQLSKLTEYCNNKLQEDVIDDNCFLELENNLQKILLNVRLYVAEEKKRRG